MSVVDDVESSGITDYDLKDVIRHQIGSVSSADEDSDSDSESSEYQGMDYPSITAALDADQSPAVDTSEHDGTKILPTGVSPSIAKMSTYVDLETETAHVSRMKRNGYQQDDVYRSAPIFTSEVSTFLESTSSSPGTGPKSFTQFGLLGLRCKNLSENGELAAYSENSVDPKNDLVIANMDMPWSAFICGSQGAGKSHTLSCLLENALLGNDKVGKLPNPLAAAVFHYDNYTSSSCSQINEAAYLCSSGIPVTVLVSPSNIWTMTELYANLQGLPANAPRPKVLPLYLSESLLNISTMLKLMAIDQNSDSTPLYMEIVTKILRQMAMEGKGAGAFSYTEFRDRLEEVSWAPGQQVPLNLRLQLLDSFLEPSKYTVSTRPAPATENIWAFKPGTLTIIDLSDPFVSSNDACSLFSICLSLFLDGRGQCGRIVALDEAHKFLLQSSTAAQSLTSDLTSIIRQQRHTGTRVVIATQEPTLSHQLIDLANVTIVHRFSSPAWYDTLKKHLAGANKYETSRGKTSLFEVIVALEAGEALLFCPSAAVGIKPAPNGASWARRLGDDHLHVRIRHRLTADGGKSILASETTVGSVERQLRQIPMHIVAKSVSSGMEGKGKAGKISPPLSGPRAITPASATGAQPATKTSTNSINDSKTALLKRIRKETRARIRTNFNNLQWRTLNNKKFREVAGEVEVALNLPSGTIRTDNTLFVPMRFTAEEELASCLKDSKSK